MSSIRGGLDALHRIAARRRLLDGAVSVHLVRPWLLSKSISTFGRGRQNLDIYFWFCMQTLLAGIGKGIDAADFVSMGW